MKLRALVLGAIVAVAGAWDARAASVPPVNAGQCQLPSACVDINSQAIPNVNVTVPGFAGEYTAKNFLDNGAFSITQRGTATTTGGTTSGPSSTAYVADRWAIETNVASGQGTGAVVTSVTGTTLAPAFPNAVSVYRAANALTQPISLEQEVEAQRWKQLQGKSVIMSCYLGNNAVVPTGNTVTFHLFTGTLAAGNEGLGASTVFGSAVGMTASPALTPAMTGIATAGSYTTPALTTTMTRYSSQPIAVPTTTTEGVFELDWTPGTESAGTTDGIVVQGCQLEIADPGQYAAGMASAFEFLPPSIDLMRAQRFFWQITDTAATTEIPSACFVTVANTTVKCGVFLPQQMIAAPITTASGATASFGIVVTAGTAGTCTALNATASSNTTRSIGVTCTTGGTIALGSATPLIGAATTQTLSASADF